LKIGCSRTSAGLLDASAALTRLPSVRAPADGVVSVIVAEVGENIRAGQPVLAIEGTGKQWLSFNVRPLLVAGLPGGPLH
jgi:multidrug resistance efflux pump